VTCKRFFLISI